MQRGGACGKCGSWTGPLDQHSLGPRNLHCWYSERLASCFPPHPPLLQGWVLTKHSLTGTPGLRSLIASHTKCGTTNTKDGEHKRQLAQMKLLQDILLQGTLLLLLRQVII